MLTVRDIFRAMNREDFLLFYNANYEPGINLKALSDQIMRFSASPQQPCELRLALRECGVGVIDVVGVGVASEEDVPGQPDLVGQEIDFALDLHPWGAIMSMQIDVKTLVDFPEHEIAAHVFEEMIYFGWDGSGKAVLAGKLDTALREIKE